MGGGLKLFFYNIHINTVISILFLSTRVHVLRCFYSVSVYTYFSLTRVWNWKQLGVQKKKRILLATWQNKYQKLFFSTWNINGTGISIYIAGKIRFYRINIIGNNTVTGITPHVWHDFGNCCFYEIVDPSLSNRYRILANQSTKKVVGSTRDRRNRAKRTCENDWWKMQWKKENAGKCSKAKLTSRAPNYSYVFQQKLSFLSSGKAQGFLALPPLFRDPLYILPVLSVYLSRFPTRRLDESLRKFQVFRRTAHRSFCRRESFVIHTTGWTTLLLISS